MKVFRYTASSLVTLVVSTLGSLSRSFLSFISELSRRSGGDVPPALYDEASWATPRAAPFLRMACTFAARRGAARSVRGSWVSAAAHAAIYAAAHAAAAARVPAGGDDGGDGSGGDDASSAAPGDGASDDGVGDEHADDESVGGVSLMPSQGGMSGIDADSLGGSEVSEEELEGLGGVG